MYLVVIKLVEVMSRALFVVGATYFLPLEKAGQFGILVTMASLFTFAGNYERHHDIQRRSVGMAPPDFDRAVKNALPFWGFNILVVLPVYVACMLLIGRMPIELVLLTLPIPIGEQVSTHAYQMATVEPRYNGLVTVVAVKNALLAAAAYVLLFASRGHIALPQVIALWSVVQVVAVAVILGGWLHIQRAAPPDAPLRVRLFRQHRLSLTHFQIGAVAIATLQFDRLGVGMLLRLAEVGIYFRHVLAVSFVYQFLSVTFINRATPVIFGRAKQGEPRETILRRPARELAGIVALALVGLAALVTLDHALGGLISQRFTLSWALLGILLASSLIRVSADCAAVFCNAWHREKVILRSQLTAFVAGATLLFVLTPFFGMTGPALASLAFSATYLTLMARAIRAMPRTAHA